MRQIDKEAWKAILWNEAKVENESGLKPLGRAVLVEDYQPERKSGVIVLPDSVAKRESSIEQRARVVEVGPEAWEEEKVPRARPGDLVLVAKYSGYLAMGPNDEKWYRLVNDRDIFAGITKEKDRE